MPQFLLCFPFFILAKLLTPHRRCFRACRGVGRRRWVGHRFLSRFGDEEATSSGARRTQDVVVCTNSAPDCSLLTPPPSLAWCRPMQLLSPSSATVIPAADGHAWSLLTNIARQGFSLGLSPLAEHLSLYERTPITTLTSRLYQNIRTGQVFSPARPTKRIPQLVSRTSNTVHDVPACATPC